MPGLVYDSIEAHLPHAADIARASAPMGMLLAWCAKLHLLSEATVTEHEQLILRLRFEEATGSELLIACGGVLSRDLFNAAGQRFLDGYYTGYMDVFRSVFGADCYTVSDNHANYQKLAPVLTRAYMGKPGAARKTDDGLLGKLSRWLKR